MAGAWQSMVHRVIKSWTQLKQLSMHACTHIACRQWNLYGNHFGDITFYLFIHLLIHLDPLFSWIPNTFINLIYGEKSVINWGQGSVQFSRSVVSNSLRPRGLQHGRPPCPSPTPRAFSKLMSIEWVMPSNHLILWRPLLLPPSIFPSISVFFNESVLRIRLPKYWSFSFSISPSNEYSGLISFRIDCLDLLAV